MVNFFIYAADNSMSTKGRPYFNSKGLKTLQCFKNEVKTVQDSAGGSNKEDRVVYLHWSDKCKNVDENEVAKTYKEQSGNGSNTCPHTILDWMADNIKSDDTIQLLYVITDGCISPYDIKPIDPNVEIENVTFHALNAKVTNIDMSVASMFICKNKRYIVYCNEKLVDDIDLSNPFDYDLITVENFHEKKDELKSYIKLQFLNKTSSDRLALDEIKKLKSLQTRLCKELQNDTDEPVVPVKIDLNVKDKETFIYQFKNTKFYKILTQTERYDVKQKIASCINTLVNYINNDHKSYDFDNLKFNTKFTPETEEEDVGNVYYDNVEEIPFPDIILDNESGVPVILLTHYNLMEKILLKKSRKAPKHFKRNCKPGIHGHRRTRRLDARAQPSHMSHFSRFRKSVDCPLILLNDPNFKNSIEYYYNLESFKAMKKNSIRNGPRTRQPFTGAIVPLEEFDDYNDFILSCTYFNQRRVPYNKGLLYYVVYKTCEKLEYIEPNVVEYLKRYVMKRIAKTTSFLGLSKMSIDDPLIRVDLTTALWYCLEMSSILFKNDSKHFRKEKIRMYCHYSDYMKEILEWFQYDVDTKSVDIRANIFRHINKLKRIARPEDKTIHILEQIFKKEDRYLISEIVNPDNIYKLNFLLMDHNDVIDESLLSADVDIHKFAHFMDHVETTDVPVCKLTMRPHFVTEGNKSFYEQLKMKTSKVLIQNGKLTLEPVDRLDFTRILSTNKLYISNVKRYLKYPTLEQFKIYVWKTQKYFRGKPVVFATNTLETIEKTLAEYDKVNPDVTEFLKLAKSSANREDRIRKENPTDLNMNELSDYVKKSAGNVTFNRDTKESTTSCQKTSPVVQPGKHCKRKKSNSIQLQKVKKNI